MPNTKSTLTVPARHPARLRAAAVIGAAAAAAIVWLFARYALGIHLHTPAFGSQQKPSALGLGFAVIAGVVASLLALGTVALIERASRNPRRNWVIIGLLGLAVSLSGPASGHGVTSTDRWALICMHLAVAAVLIPVLAASIHRGPPPADDTVARSQQPAAAR